jgi:PAS domain S-box-containing protein
MPSSPRREPAGRILGFLRPPLFPEDEDKTREARVLGYVVRLSLLFVVAGGLVGVPFLFHNKVGGAALLLATVAGLLLAWRMALRGNVARAWHVLAGSSWVVFAILNVFSGGTASPSIACFVTLTAMVGMGRGRGAALAVAVPSVLVAVGTLLAPGVGVEIPKLFTIPPATEIVILVYNLALAGAIVVMAKEEVGDALKLARARLADRRRLEEAYRSLAEDSVQGLAILQRGRLVFCNRALGAMLGRPVEELLALSAEQVGGLAHVEDRDGVVRALARPPVGDRTASPVEFRVLWPGGEVRWVEAFVRGVAFEGAPAAQVACLDVTGRRHAQEEQARLEVKLGQAAKMEAVGRLAGGVAHDFNNVLTAILGNVSVAEFLTPKGHAAREPLAEVRRAAGHAADLTKQLLAFSRGQAVAPAVLDLGELTAEMHAMLQRLIGDDIAFVHQRQPGATLVHADPGQLRQVVMNLVVNARDVMRGGGRLTVETAVVEVDEAACRAHPGAVPGPRVMLAVKDTGSGMTDEVKERLFEPFFTTKPKGEGTGLGLATVYSVVTKAGGWVDVESCLGAGSSFRVFLPQAGAAPGPQEAPAREARDTSGAETVLLVEDDAPVRELAGRALTEAGYRVLPCADGEEASRVAASHAGPLDLLLADVVMPRVDGPALARLLRQARPGLKVLFTSGPAAGVAGGHGLSWAGFPHIPQPFSPEALAATVRSVLDAPVVKQGRDAENQVPRG